MRQDHAALLRAYHTSVGVRHPQDIDRLHADPAERAHWMIVAMVAAGLVWHGQADPALYAFARSMDENRRPPVKGADTYWAIVLWARMSGIVAGPSWVVDAYTRSAPLGAIADAFVRLSQMKPDMLLVFGGGAEDIVVAREVLQHFALLGMHGLAGRFTAPTEAHAYAVRDTFLRIARCYGQLEGFESYARTFGAAGEWYVAQVRQGGAAA